MGGGSNREERAGIEKRGEEWRGDGAEREKGEEWGREGDMGKRWCEWGGKGRAYKTPELPSWEKP